MATEVDYSIPKGSLNFWKTRFEKLNISYKLSEKFGEKHIAFSDPDGLNISLIESRQKDNRKGRETDEINADVAIKGFYTVTLILNNIKGTATILTEVFGYNFLEQKENLYRYQTESVENAALIDLLEMPLASKGLNAGGTIHHIAFRVKDEETLMAFREKIVSKGLHITEKINRDYFFSLYFREPGGVLFEIATDNPGFATDETVEKLGTSLQLPIQHEPLREKIEKALPVLKTDDK